MSIRDLANLLDGRLRLGAMPPLGGPLEPLGRIVVDCGKIRPGDVFWQLPHSSGEEACAEEAFCRNASGVVTSGRRVEPWAGKFVLDVADSAAALRTLLQHTRDRFRGQVLATAGYTGKTTTAHWLHSALRSRRTGMLCQCVAEQSWPLPLLDLRHDADYGILELHGRHAPELATLAGHARPDVLVVTQSHDPYRSETHGPSQKIVSTLLGTLPTHSWLVINGDDPELMRMTAHRRGQVLTIGRGAHCDLIATNVHCRDGRLAFDVDGVRIETPTWVRHHLHGVLAAYAVARILELPPQEAVAGLRNHRPPVGACQVVRTDRFTFVADLPRQRPVATIAALDVLRELTITGRRFVVVPDSVAATSPDNSLRRFGDAIVTRCGADAVVGIGAAGEQLITAARHAGMPRDRAIHCESVPQAMHTLRSMLDAGDGVLIAGQNEQELNHWIQALVPVAMAAAA